MLKIKEYKYYKIGRFSKVAYFWLERKYLPEIEIIEFEDYKNVNY